MGTCFEYGFQAKVDELSEISPLNSYAQAKNLLRIYIKKIKPKYTNFTWGRLFYVYGKNQPTHTLYGQYINYKNDKNKLKNLIKNKNLELDYLNINSVCRYVYILLLNKKNNNEVNICSGKKISLQNLLNKWSKKKMIKIKNKNSKFFYGSNTKLKSIIHESKNKITIIIISYNRPKYLKRSIDYYISNGFNVIVIDGSKKKQDSQIKNKKLRYVNLRKSYHEDLFTQPNQ